MIYDYEFTFDIPKLLNQELLDIEIKAVLGVAFVGTMIVWTDSGNNLAAGIVIYTNRELTQGELDAIATN